MSEEKKPFTVSDRRHFTASGEARESSVEEAGPAASASGGTKPPEVSSPPASATLAGFLLGLAAQGASALQPPEEGEAVEERTARLEEARHIISILEMLKDKTEGRRTAEEQEVLDGVLYELRMAYLHWTTRTGRA